MEEQGSTCHYLKATLYTITNTKPIIVARKNMLINVKYTVDQKYVPKGVKLMPSPLFISINL